MIRKIGFSLLAAGLLFMAGQPSSYAAGAPSAPTVKAPGFPVTVNGSVVDNKHSLYPLLLYRDITYFPMTWNYTHDAFGWTTSWDATNGFGVQACEKVPGADARQAAALNLANGGQLAVQGDWIYMNPANKYYGPNSLVKMKLDGSGKQTLSEDNALSINVADDWIYYTVHDKAADKNLGIFKMKTDGSQRTQISSAGAYSVWVRDGWIYYTAGNGLTINGIHKMKTDGTEDTVIVSGEVGGRFYLDGDLMYFMMPDKEHAPDSLFQIKPTAPARRSCRTV
ncbi:DUF5050 domain-containing protein [Paenibacillus oleatilyticus]|uniref:DUF5050 domain-containing protein n=1 Tax=Paenibacillus oleatilyticus TaxID=2594886 RepID=A0ABV4V166_9BACL